MPPSFFLFGVARAPLIPHLRVIPLGFRSQPTSSILPQLRTYAKKKAVMAQKAKAQAKAKLPGPLPRDLKSLADTKSAPTPKGGAKNTAKSQTTAPVYMTLAERLGAAGKQTVLFAGYPKTYVWSCFGASAFFYTWSWYNWKVNIDTPPPPELDIPNWVPTLHWFAVAVFTFAGTVCALVPARVVQKIVAVPYRPIPTRPATIKLHLFKRNVLPFLPEKRIIVDSPELLRLNEPLQPLVPPAPAPNSMARLTPGARIVARIAGLPFKMFKWVRDTITGAHFVKITLENGNTLVLMKDAWVWERRGIDKLLPLRRI